VPSEGVDDKHSDESSSSSEEDVSDSSTRKQEVAVPKKESVPEKPPKTCIVLDHGSTRGRVEVMVGPRYKTKKAWKPKSEIGKANDDKHELLGTLSVEKWDDDDNEGPPPHQTDRKALVQQLTKKEKDRKRTMHLDRWDAMLDQGRTKKVKGKKVHTAPTSLDPWSNPFHRIQSSIQRMNRGRAKGLGRVKDGNTTPNSRKKHNFKRRRTL
jgi:hypothetical protein